MLVFAHPFRAEARQEPTHARNGRSVAASGVDSLLERPYRSDRIGRIDAVEGVRRARYRIATRIPATTDPRRAAIAYLTDSHAEFGLAADLSDLEVVSAVQSPGGHHVLFRQTLAGIPLHNRTVKVSLDRGFQPSMVVSGYSPKMRAFAGSFDPRPVLTARQAIEAVRAELDDPDLEATEPELVAVADDPPRLAWKVVAWPSRTPKEWLFLVDARSGQVVTRFEQSVNHRFVARETDEDERSVVGMAPVARSLRAANVAAPTGALAPGSGFAFLPDPLTSAGVPYGTPYVDGSDGDIDVINAERKTVQLRDITRGDDGRYRLEGPYVRITAQQTPGKPVVAFTPPSEVDPNGFFYSRSDDRFEAVNAYYHLDTSQRYVQSLGFTDVQNAPLPVNPHGHGTEDNSQYFPSLNYLSFGDGGIDDAEDADVLWHEYGHALLEGASPGLRSTVEGQSVHEGWSDYWAASQRRSLFESGTVPDAGDWRRLFPWDGNNLALSPPWLGRTLNAVGTFPGVRQDLYTPGVHWATSVMEIFDVVGRKVSDRLHLQSHRYLSAPVTYRDLAEALVQADVDLYGGAHTSLIIEVLGQRGYLDPGDFGPQVAHVPQGDTEQLGGSISLEITVLSLLFPIARVEIVAEVGGEPAVSLEATAQGSNRYTVELPLPSVAAVVRYFVRAEDSEGRSTVLPASAPIERFEFQAGPDAEAPSISTRPLTSASLLGWPPVVEAQVTDNLGIDSVWVAYRHLQGAGGVILGEGTFLLSPDGERYLGPFPIPDAAVSDGDVIEYRLGARDVAGVANAGYRPPLAEDPFRFTVQSLGASYDFEGTVAGLGIGGEWSQGSPSFGLQFAHSGTEAMATNPDGPYSASSGTSSLDLPAVDLSGLDEAFLVFWHWYDFEHDGDVDSEGNPTGQLYDGGNVKVSTDGGITWVVSAPLAGYPGSISTGFGNPLAGESAFGGYSYGWRRSVVSLPAEADVRIRFEAGTDDGNSEVSISFAGWVIDDVMLASHVDVDVDPPVVIELPVAVKSYPASPAQTDPRVIVRLQDETGVEGVFVDYTGSVAGNAVSGRSRLGMNPLDGQRFEGFIPARGSRTYHPGDYLRFTITARDFDGNSTTLRPEAGEEFEISYYLSEQLDLLGDLRASGDWHRVDGFWSLTDGAGQPSSLVLQRADLPNNAEAMEVVVRHAFRLPETAGGNLKVSDDGGATWRTLEPNAGYGTVLPANIPGVGGEPGFSGTSGPANLESRFDMSGHSNRQVQFRFDFGAGQALGNDAFWRLEAVWLDLRTASSESFERSFELALHPNFPDPFTASTTVSYTLAERSTATLELFDVLGRRTATLVDSELGPGTYSYVLNGTGIAPGMYLLRLIANGRQLTETITFVR